MADRFVLNDAGQPVPYAPSVPPTRHPLPPEPEKPYQVGDRLTFVVTVREMVHRGGGHWNVRLVGSDVDFWLPDEKLAAVATPLRPATEEQAEALARKETAGEPKAETKAGKRPPARKTRLTPAETK
ncbi:MAG TPA: hypothetical protein VKT32_10615 [Chthonomonadaceae bacterium]|nr:hypothetical protein [Chthonomonadaceae bacterium]